MKQSKKLRWLDTPQEHTAGLLRQLILGSEPCTRRETETWIGTACRVKLNIYLGDYGREASIETVHLVLI